MEGAVVTLSILIATLHRREKKLRSLLAGLIPQVEAHKGSVEVVIYLNGGEKPIGEFRQTLLEAARGEYICFVDDDDSLPQDYCDEIINAVASKPDYVGFKVKFSNNGIERQPATHSLKYLNWSQDENGYYRGVTHLNPIKRELALRGSFSGAEGAGEDEDWARQVQPHVKTEVFIDKFMYYYHHDTEDSHFGGRLPGKHISGRVENKHLRYVGSI